MQLNYRKFGDNGSVIVILHGFLGSLDNWLSIAKILSENHQVYIVDQRNHGRSPHEPEMDYWYLADDLLDFLLQHQISQVTLLGHSMGGKTAMLFALHHPNMVQQLIVVDIAPVNYQGGHEYILDAMMSLKINSFQHRNEVEAALRKSIHSEAILQFILKNLGRNEEGEFYWKPNLSVLSQKYRNLMIFPYTSSQYIGSTLFIKGGISDYVNVLHQPAYRKYFPRLILIEVEGAGHWVQAEKPAEFLSVLLSNLEG